MKKRNDGSGNVPILIGPRGSKRTVSLTARQLLAEPGKGSFIVIDPKGESAAVVANDRRKGGGDATVKIINPYGVLPDFKPDGRNPLNDKPVRATK